MASSERAGERPSDSTVAAVVAHINAVQERAGTRLAQIEATVPTSKFGPVVLVDVEYLVRDVLGAAGSGRGSDVPTPAVLLDGAANSEPTTSLDRAIGPERIT